MSKITYKEAREMLSHSCERYIIHNKVQLAKTNVKSPEMPDEDCFFDRALGSNVPRTEFFGWVGCEYSYLLDHILELDKTYCYRGYGYHHYEIVYPPCASKITFFPAGRIYLDYFNSRDYVIPSLVLDRLMVLVGLIEEL